MHHMDAALGILGGFCLQGLLRPLQCLHGASQATGSVITREKHAYALHDASPPLAILVHKAYLLPCLGLARRGSLCPEALCVPGLGVALEVATIACLGCVV